MADLKIHPNLRVSSVFKQYTLEAATVFRLGSYKQHVANQQGISFRLVAEDMVADEWYWVIVLAAINHTLFHEIIYCHWNGSKIDHYEVRNLVEGKDGQLSWTLHLQANTSPVWGGTMVSYLTTSDFGTIYYLADPHTRLELGGW